MLPTDREYRKISALERILWSCGGLLLCIPLALIIAVIALVLIPLIGFSVAYEGYVGDSDDA